MINFADPKGETIKKAYKIKVEGLVQGVGFRPFIYRIAHQNNIMGWVENRSDGVFIHAEGDDGSLATFKEDISSKSPEASSIFSLDTQEAVLKGYNDFTITTSKTTSGEITEVSPDIAVCDACLEDMERQPHRTGYPFINCTNCGPRFTIIRDLPYDRDKTTMEPFEMCPICIKEYKDVLDRRFHAQPVACNNCGPQYTLHPGERKITDINEILVSAAKLIGEGKILSIKGLGGFHLSCDALNEEAVIKLRSGKYREGKPFAVMFRDLASAERHVQVNKEEKELLSSWRRPIVILKNKSEGYNLAPSVSHGFDTTGVVIPYMPFHYLLFEKLETDAIVLTSGNLSDEPVIINNNEALERLGKVSDATITYNREIHNRADDPVTFVVNNKPRLIRRSRGYVPNPVRTDFNVEGIFAAGAELVNCFALGKGKQAILSQHIGDLQNLETFEFYRESADRFRRLFRSEITHIALDLHPDYLSTRYALELAGELGIEPIPVQHHHAHIASCMAEHSLDETVIGISFDGTGLGDDGTIWGGEILLCDLESYERFSHLEPVLLPGGDAATKNPWRTAVSYLYRTYGEDFPDMGIPFLKAIPKNEIELIVSAIKHKINAPVTTSMGRLFDAVSALTGTCTHSLFHAEAPMRLEQLVLPGIEESYPVGGEKPVATGSLIEKIVEDILGNKDKRLIATKFHNTIIDVIFASARRARQERGIEKVALSGGTFQNRYLLENTEKKLSKEGFEVYSQEQVPSNDGGIALGQLAIAARIRNR